MDVEMEDRREADRVGCRAWDSEEAVRADMKIRCNCWDMCYTCLYLFTGSFTRGPLYERQPRTLHSV